MEYEDYMQAALVEARAAQFLDEVPIGAVLVDQKGGIVARGHNRVITDCDPTAHAEMLVLRQAASRLGNYRLLSTTLYVTIEPCVMCMGALIHARVARIVFGAFDQKWGAAGSLYDFADNPRLNHQPVIISGICKEACQVLIQDFFREKRLKGDLRGQCGDHRNPVG